MAKYGITHRCGHQMTHDLFGKGSERERKIAWLKTVDCLTCRRAAERQAVASDPITAALPKLTGSEKQIAWALTIRATQLSAIAAQIEQVVANTDLSDPAQAEAMARIEAAVAAIKQQAAAGWWIDRRDVPASRLVRQAAA